MLRAVPLPIIRSPLTVHLALIYVMRFEDSLRAGPVSRPARKLFKPYDLLVLLLLLQVLLLLAAPS